MTRVDSNPFLIAFRGRFLGLRAWADVDAVWSAVRADADAGWYLYTLSDGPPSAPAAAVEVGAFVARIDRRLREDQRLDYCGFVYVDDVDRPGFIKVYEPKKFGGCGHGAGPALPSWSLSRLPPVDLVAAFAPTTPAPWWRSALG